MLKRARLAQILSLTLLLILPAQASASRHIYGPDFSRFSIDVPDGWKERKIENGCQLTAADGRTSMSVQIHRNNGKSAMEIAEIIAKNVDGKILKIEKEGKEQATIYAEVLSRRLVMLVSAEADKFAAITLAGSDMETMRKIINSIAEVNEPKK